jgi:Bromodomain
MDLSTMKKKVNSRLYQTPAAFLEDVQLMYSNCIQYNGTEHPFSESAKQLLQKTLDFMEKVYFLLLLMLSFLICPHSLES